MSGLLRVHAGARSVRGPLLVVEDTRGAMLGEEVAIQLPEGPVYRGEVIDAARARCVVQVLEETLGLAPARAAVTFRGEQVAAPVGEELLGRVLSGAGEPLDGLPAPVGEAWRPLFGAPLNPVRRARVSEFLETGVSAIDGMNALVRGQKLPVFSGAGLPGLDLAARIVEGTRAPEGEGFAVVFVGIGITEREARGFRERLEGGPALARSVLFLNRAGDPTLERLRAPRHALAVAEHLAFERGYDVLVVMADVTHYCEALREIGAAREEIPGRRGYPGYLYTDLAGLFERAGVLREHPGSVTQIPILSMPDDDVTHPIPDLTGYITEGQIVLSRSLEREGVFPPVDVLPSLSRVMNAGIGEGKTFAAHRAWADQLYALYARGREARLTAGIVGESGLPEEDRRALAFAERFEHELVHQGEARRSLEETASLGWRLLEGMPREDLTRMDEATWEARPRSGARGARKAAS
ncbi:MAG: V-type ATP synthase subunit B [Myxococcota bacterium]|nr:V-type ATP synthase subunit B [Myxococcota bacterium]